ncbi:MAG: 16S rRNA (guanine(966)-N(2))-methyltransferase RsmD [Faecalibacterium sp.]|jgi:16S rRNA (guanine(966)-N(2))-methyltransferase RsmD|nr:16S rRNA (guanine(966)-N(2))-methyltransferase RsmD [Faecalibacterium sp.]
MRVIAGEARGRKLVTLPGEDITRPTTEKVKEAMFSSVQFSLPGARVLDLFAGSGQLGIEALSRGAARCVFLDQNRDAIQIVMENCKHCNVFDRSRVSLGEASLFLSAAQESFDLVLMDPPFHKEIIPGLLPAVSRVTAPGGIVLCETEKTADLPAAAGELALAKKYQYGTIAVWRYEKEKSE